MSDATRSGAPTREFNVEDEIACLDDELGPVSQAFIRVDDEGLLRGDGVFEVIRIYSGRAFALADHLDRLERSAANLRLGWDVPRTYLERDVARVLDERGGAFDGLIRIVLTGGGRRLVMTEQLPPSPEHVRLGIVTYAPTRVLDGVKSLSYASNMLATRLARERGFDEALLVTPHGRVLEAPTSSLFYVAGDGALCTPPLKEHILASITRDALLRLTDAEERGLPVDELLDSVGEAFIASTTREVQPVAAIEDTKLTVSGERTRAAATALREHIASSLG